MRLRVAFFAVEGSAIIGLPPFCAPRPNEIDLAADAAVKIIADGIRAHLAGGIYFEGGVDRDLLVVPADYERIIGISAGMKLENRIVIDKIVKPARAQHKPQDHLTRMQRFLFVCDDPFSMRSTMPSLTISV